jgi:cell shape-determining protein MreC
VLRNCRRRQLANLASFQSEKTGLESELGALERDNQQLRQQLVQQRQTLERWAPLSSARMRWPDLTCREVGAAYR